MQHTIVAQPFHRRIAQIVQVCRLAQIGRWLQQRWTHTGCKQTKVTACCPPLVVLATQPLAALPPFVRQSPLAVKYIHLLGAIDWPHFPQRKSGRAWPGPEPQSPVPYIIALLIRIDQRHQSMGALVDLLRQQPELAWLAGFATTLDAAHYSPSAVAATVPSAAQFSWVLRQLPHTSLQFVLDQTVDLLRQALPDAVCFGETVAFDTKHILAWVKENNPKEYIPHDRFDKHAQPAGDRDCKLGCKRRRNKDAPQPTLPTPAKEGKPAEHLGSGLGEFYWGYASGIAVTKTPLWGEFVLAECTQTFDQPDVSYFSPLMQQVERRLGRKPRFGAADAAFDAHYIYDYFHTAGGFAAIPNRFGDTKQRHFTDDGRPLCAAGLPMTLLCTYFNRTSRIPYQANRWACPLCSTTGQSQAQQPCPVAHPQWSKGGCRSALPVADGARIRHQLDRHSAEYQTIYNQRTACERIFSQAVALGIEQPKLRNGHSIANLNTLIYALLNLRTLQRVLDMQRHLPTA